jgi:hypothetical protein
MAKNEKSKVLPFTYKKDKEGNMQIVKSKARGLQLYSWGAVSPCCGEDCPAFESCPFEKRGKCKVEAQYLENTEIMIFTNFGPALNETQIFRIGMHLMPIYKTLCKLKIYEQSIGTNDLMTEDDKGRRKVDPIFKELRETYKTLKMVWEDIGLNRIEPVNNVPEPEVEMKKTHSTMGDVEFTYDD